MQAVSALCTPSLLPLNPGPVSCCQVRCHRRPRCKPGALRDMKGVSGRSAGRSQECPLLPPPVALECPASPPFPGTPVTVFTQEGFGKVLSRRRLQLLERDTAATTQLCSAYFSFAFQLLLASELSGLLLSSFKARLLALPACMDAPWQPERPLRILLSADTRASAERVVDLEAELSAQRSEISRLHGRLRRLEAELQQGRNWLLFLSDKLSALEDKTQQLVVRIRALISIFKETLGEVVARLQIWF